MLLKPFRQNCICWICLEESGFDSSWIRHECGCNLQVHKVCYLHWLYCINNEYISRALITKNASLVTEDNLRRTMCYMVDGHRDLQRDVSLADLFRNLPFIKSKSSESIRYPLSIIGCPQCKKNIVNHQITFTSRSPLLAFFFCTRRIVRYITIPLTLAFSTLNIGKWLFKLGLWQMRCIFPENVLRVVLDISTTRALDVYGETMNGLASVPQLTRFLVFGFPLYLMGTRSSYSTLNRFRWLYSLVLAVRAGHYDSQATKVLSRTLTACNIYMLLHYVLISPVFSRIYEYMVKSVNPYFLLTDRTLDLFPSQEYGDVIIKTSWYDVVFESVVWPALGGMLGGKLFDTATWLQNTLGLQWSPSFSPNDCKMIFNFVGCGITAIARQLLNLWVTHLRVKELKQLQENIGDDAH